MNERATTSSDSRDISFEIPQVRCHLLRHVKSITVPAICSCIVTRREQRINVALKVALFNIASGLPLKFERNECQWY